MPLPPLWQTYVRDGNDEEKGYLCTASNLIHGWSEIQLYIIEQKTYVDLTTGNVELLRLVLIEQPLHACAEYISPPEHRRKTRQHGEQCARCGSSIYLLGIFID